MEDMSLLHQEQIDFLKVPNFGKLLEWPWSCQKLTHVKIDQKGPRKCYKVSLVSKIDKKFQWEVS